MTKRSWESEVLPLNYSPEALGLLGTRVPIKARCAHQSSEERESFVGKVRASGAVWISNEGKPVLPGVSASLPPNTENGTVLAVNGSPVAIVGPHGQFFHDLNV